MYSSSTIRDDVDCEVDQESGGSTWADHPENGTDQGSRIRN